MSVVTKMSLALMVSATKAEHPSGFPPGWNGVALTPPMGWRSWNSYGARISQSDMESTIDAMNAKLWNVGGKPNVSLIDAGFTTAGIDEGWEGCGQGVNGTQHDAKGNPVINSKFSDMAGLVKYGHDHGLKMGWYENGCACGERREVLKNYEGDVRLLHDFGFDGVKLDGCGAQRNMTLYAQLMASTGKPYMIENCHWGKCTNSDDSSCPTADWCPFNWFRTSGDINNSPMSWLKNLQTTIQFQDPKAPLSRPGCWAYPDMLEVGRIMVDGKMNVGWNRAHFGAWCVISAPLILGLDLTQYDLVASVVDIITNQEAIAVNQAWAGHPGGLVWSGLGSTLGFPAARACNPPNLTNKQFGWNSNILANGTSQIVAPDGGCLKVQGPGFQGGAGGLIIAACNSSDENQVFYYNESTLELSQPSSGHCVDVHSGGPIVWMYGCSSSDNDKVTFDAMSSLVKVNGLCVGMESDDPAGSTYESTLQAWAKPLPGSRGVAVVMINPDTVPHEFAVPISALPLMGSGTNLTGKALNVRDIWGHSDLPKIAAGEDHIRMTIGGMDSAFLQLSATEADGESLYV